MRREIGIPEEPEWLTLHRERLRADAHAKREREVAQHNAAVSYDFLKRHHARVAITVDGVTFETDGDDLDAVIAQANARLREKQQADDEARRVARSLTFGT
jgi:F0F1-type ATP synthase epsilon subunit